MLCPHDFGPILQGLVNRQDFGDALKEPLNRNAIWTALIGFGVPRPYRLYLPKGFIKAIRPNNDSVLPDQKTGVGVVITRFIEFHKAQ